MPSMPIEIGALAAKMHNPWAGHLSGQLIDRSARHGLPARQPDPKMTATGRRTPGTTRSARSRGVRAMGQGLRCQRLPDRPLRLPRPLRFWSPQRRSRADHRHDRHRHAGHHHEHRDHRRGHSPAEAARKAPAEGRQVRHHQVPARVEQLHVRPARHQRDDGEQAAVRCDGRLSAGRQRLHVPEQS